MHVDFAVLADYALVDQHGKLSVMGIFQHVWVPVLPTIYPRAHLVLRVRGKRTELGEHRLRIRFEGPDGREVLGGEGAVQFGEPPAGVRDVEAAAVLIFDLPLATPGEYAFTIALDGETEYRVPLTAAVIPAPNP